MDACDPDRRQVFAELLHRALKISASLLPMEKMVQILEESVSFMRRCLFRIVSVGPIPEHVAFIMDGNRRFAKKLNSEVGTGHRAGYSSLMSMLVYCYELGVKYVTVYAFSIDNFKRKPQEVEYLMDLMLEKIEGLLEKEDIVNRYGVRVYFVGDLSLLDERVRLAAEKAMKATRENGDVFLLVCVAYTSCNEIAHAVQESCKAKSREMQRVLGDSVDGESCGVAGSRESGLENDFSHEAEKGARKLGSEVSNGESCGVAGSREGGPEKSFVDEPETGTRKLGNKASNCESSLARDMTETGAIKLTDIEKHMYMAVAPDPDIVIRSSGEMRLSNFLLWQTATCPLYSPAALWPELGLRHLVWAVLNFQRSYKYLEKKRKES